MAISIFIRLFIILAALYWTSLLAQLSLKVPWAPLSKANPVCMMLVSLNMFNMNFGTCVVRSLLRMASTCLRVISSTLWGMLVDCWINRGPCPWYLRKSEILTLTLQVIYDMAYRCPNNNNTIFSKGN